MAKSPRLLFRKGVIEMIFYIGEKGEAGYYEMYKQDYVVSRQTFSNILKLLEKQGIVNRIVLDTHPPRVNYSLTEKGERIKIHLERIEEELE